MLDLPHADHPTVHAALAAFEAALAGAEAAADPRVDRARRWAALVHASQVRPDGTATPYLAHPLRVATRLLGFWPSAPAHVVAAALLHDTLEDQAAGMIAQAHAEGQAAASAPEAVAAAFGADTLRVVLALTNEDAPPGVDRAAAYREHVVRLVLDDAEAGPVKLADLHDNALSLAALPDGPRRRKLARKYQPVLRELAERLPHLPPAHPLAARGAERAAELQRALATEPYTAVG